MLALNKSLENIREHIRTHTQSDETLLVQALIKQSGLDASARQVIAQNGAQLVRQVRENSDPTLMENFLGEFGLSTKEGIALMCLAEALLRIPDAPTVDALIADKISSSHWDAHLGKASSSLVNASTWALMLTGRVLSDDDERGLIGTLQGLVRKMGEPVIRTAVAQAMRELGKQFVLGETINDALHRGKSMREKGYTYSFDMLGEAAVTQEDAARYHLAYADAITQISKHAKSDVRDNPGISVKLSALHPRYETSQSPRMIDALVSRTKSLAVLAMAANIGFNIDAEEAARLDISLDVIEAVLSDPGFEGWDGFGVVVQTYSKRAGPVIDWLHQLAITHQRKIMVRLVKGAYWDSEIKDAQVQGLAGYRVFTRKENTDVSYISCAQKLLSMRDYIYPQFATHNAHSVAAIQYMAKGQPESYEFQRLHGMGEALLDEVVSSGLGRCRIYAPVGAHKDLLAYLVRRLLENGANSSFVHKIVDESVSPESIAADPFLEVKSPAENSNIPLPKNLFGNSRINSIGLDFNDPSDLAEIKIWREPFKTHLWRAAPLIAGKITTTRTVRVYNPSELSEQVGTVSNTHPSDVDMAISAALAAKVKWSAKPAELRAQILIEVADLFEAHRGEFYALLAREAGKTIADCIGEVREAVDFLRYYAGEAVRLEKQGEARGVFTCISPWNFPLAIFTGQIAAALGAGNCVLAKPAEQSPLIAHRAVQLFHQAGIPLGVLQYLPGEGSTIGAALTSNPNIDGVCFTGSTATAQMINRSMAQNLAGDAPLIAETGGINAMIVDSSALPEQAVRDVVASAFQSAGQRCSACRIVYLQADIAEDFITMLRGAMKTLSVGNPWLAETDIGPLIDQVAFDDISKVLDLKSAADNYLLQPALKMVNGIDDIDREIFGPVLHIATFEADEIEYVVDQINQKGFGLTFGLHTRIDARVEQITQRINCGNIYINRNQIGAVVGSQPFGGLGLSGTGPKAGGPHYLTGFMQRKNHSNSETPPLPTGKLISSSDLQQAIDMLIAKPAPKSGAVDAALAKVEFVADTDLQHTLQMPGPTGESNILSTSPKGLVLCFGPKPEQLIQQACAALASGCRVVTICGTKVPELRRMQKSCIPIRCVTGYMDVNNLAALEHFDVVSMHNSGPLKDMRTALAQRSGKIISIVSDPTLATAFMHEHHLCIDTTAAGGNAALMLEAEE